LPRSCCGVAQDALAVMPIVGTRLFDEMTGRGRRPWRNRCHAQHITKHDERSWCDDRVDPRRGAGPRRSAGVGTVRAAVDGAREGASRRSPSTHRHRRSPGQTDPLTIEEVSPVLSVEEQRQWAEIERLFHLTAAEPLHLAAAVPRLAPVARHRPRVAVCHRRASVAVIVAAWLSLLLGMLGVFLGAACLAVATSLSWVLFCHWFGPPISTASPGRI
jgi:hypothetical protein